MNSQPNTHFLLCLFLTIFPFPTILKASAANIPLNFSFTSFNPSEPEIFLEGDTTVGKVGIELTINLSDKGKNGSIGRATYTKPLHLWDKASGNRTNFTTHFSIIVNEQGRPKYEYADGLAFFLAPNGSRIRPGTKPGGGLGLAINDSMAEDFKENNFVAAEFDTYPNTWDPIGVTGHVGINVRSMSSNVTVIWPITEIKERRTNAWINYDSSKKVLNVTFSYVDQISNLTIRDSLSAVVDLAEYLPEWVTFGFSGSAGLWYQVHRITSWEFNSSSDIVDSVSTVSMPNVEPAASPEISNESKNNIGLMAGLIIGVVICVLILCGCFVLFGFRRKQRKLRKEMKTDDVVFDVSFDDDFKNGTGPRKFSYNELADATNNFSENEKLGEGGFGTVYRGFLNDLNSYIAVKRVSRGSKQGIKEYAAEVKIISRMRHRNLVKLIGWCHEKELLLAYELMPNGSLDSHLFMGKAC